MTTTTSNLARPTPPPSRTAAPSIWTCYRVRWTFLTKLCASVPADPEIVQKWIDARQPATKPASAKSIEDINEEVLESLAAVPEESYSMLVFQRQADALVMRAATVKAHLKDCARVISAQFVGRVKGERAFSTRVVNGVYLDPEVYWLPVKRPDGSHITEADGAYDKPVHVRGPRGEPLNALKRFEFIAPPAMLEFQLRVLGTSVTEKDLHILLQYGGTHGYAGERSDGEGRYTYTIDPE